MGRLKALKAVLAMIALYHLVLGGAALFSHDLAGRIAREMFGLDIAMTPQLGYILQLLGVYAAAFGLFSGVVALDPVRHRPMLDLIVALYGLRILNKFLSMEIFAEAFHAPMAKVWIDVALLAAFGAAVALLKPPKPEAKPA